MTSISVIMPTYNAAEYVAQAIESVVKQSFTDWELIIVDDGSTDNTVEIIRTFKDERIRLICNQHDYIDTLNRGIEESQSKYIARMDADDIMCPDRLKIQYKIMESEPEIIVCASRMIAFGKGRPAAMVPSIVGRVENIKQLLMRCNPIFHPTVMLRREFLSQNSLKYEEYKYAEDYKLWFEIAKRGGVFFIEDQPLMWYRLSEGQVSKSHAIAQKETSLKVREEVLNYFVDQMQEYSSIHPLVNAMKLAREEHLITEEQIYDFFCQVIK